MLEDNKNLSLNITLVWAIHANDCLHINYVYQLANWIQAKFTCVKTFHQISIHGTAIKRSNL